MFILIFLLESCLALDDNGSSTDCSAYNCISVEPTEANLSIKCSINIENKYVPIEIYKGKYEEKNLFLCDTLYQEKVSIRVPVDERYTIAAKYKSNKKTIIAIDATHLYTTSATQCDSTCWVIYGGNIDVRLRYSY